MIKKIKVLAIAFCLIFVAMPTLSGCQSKNEIVMWDSYYVGFSDASIPRSEWYITQAISRFKEQNPQYKNLSIRYENIPHSMESISLFKNVSINGTAPDIVTLWSSSYAMSVKEYLLPLDDYITQEEKDTITGWWSVSDGLKDGGSPIYGYPTNDGGIVCIFYNKTLVNSLGLNFENDAPYNFDEFLDVCEIIKTAGETPLLISYQDGSQDAATISYWYGQAVGGAEHFSRLNTGEVKFSTEEAFSHAIEQQKKLYDLSYTNVDVLTADSRTVGNRFIAGQGAMTIGNTWLIAAFYPEMGESLGMMVLPNITDDAQIKNTGTGGPGLLLGVGKNSKRKQASVDFIKFLESKDEMLEFVKYNPRVIPNRTDIDYETALTNPLLKQQARWIKENGSVAWLDNVIPSNVSDEWFRLAPLYFTGSLSKSEYLRLLDEAF